MTQVSRMRSARGVGAYAAERREQRGLTQTELAKRAGVSREWVSRFERGDGSPSLRAVMDVLRELDVVLFAETADDPVDQVTSEEREPGDSAA